MSAHLATTGAIAFSGTTLILCLGSLFAVWSEMQELWQELDQQMDIFKVNFGEHKHTFCRGQYYSRGNYLITRKGIYH
jgi:hypothetical protein